MTAQLSKNGFYIPEEFIKEIHVGLVGWIDWKIITGSIVAASFYMSIVLYLASIPVPEQTQDDIRELQKKFATLVLKQDKKIIMQNKKKNVDPDKTKQEIEKKESAKERINKRKESSKESLKKIREENKALRVERRNAAASKIANMSVFNQLAALDDEVEDVHVTDVIGTVHRSNYEVDGVLNSLASNRETDRIRTRRTRSTASIQQANNVMDIVGGLVGKKSMSLTHKGKVSIDVSSIRGDNSSLLDKKNAEKSTRDYASINKMIATKRGAIQYCFKQEQKRNPKLSGKLTVRFDITNKGVVRRVKILENTTKSKSLEKCLGSHIRKMKFDEIVGTKGSMTVTYPFVFVSG